MAVLGLNRVRFVLVWICLLLCVGCEQTETWVAWPPPVHFAPYPVRHPLDLTQILGAKTQLIAGQDSLDLRITYHPATHLNLLTNARTGDTLQQVWVTRYRRLYYFTWPINDTCYWVHAVRIRQGEVQGLLDAHYQLKQLEQAVRAGEFSPLLQFQDSASGTLKLRFHQKTLRKFYSIALDSLPIYQIAAHSIVKRPAEGTRPLALAKALLEDMYPNPATDFVQLRLAATSACEAVLFDVAGNIVSSTTTTSATAIIPVHTLVPGHYVLRIREATTGRTASRQLVVAR